MKASVSAALYISAKCRANFIPFHKKCGFIHHNALSKRISLHKWQRCGSGSEEFEEIFKKLNILSFFNDLLPYLFDNVFFSMSTKC
jgi:hypothetical protein